MDDNSSGKLRREGYENALKDNGIKIDESPIIPMNCNAESYSMKAGYLTMQEALSRGIDFTAVFAVSDAVAIGACRAIADAGKKIPEDISVAGFDGIDNAKYYTPRITTIRQPFEDMARASINLLFKYIEDDKSANKAQQRLFEGELIIGESTKRI